MTDLVLPDRNEGESHFARTIREVASGDIIDIACPYIQLDILRGLVDDVDTWRLITDLPEWFSIVPSSRHDATVEFVTKHLDSIRDVRGIHAKCVIGDERAYTGSANLTYQGLGANHEIGVLLDESAQLDKLSAWFDSLWSRGLERSPSDMAQLADLADEQTSNPSSSTSIRGDWQVESTALSRTSVSTVLKDEVSDNNSTTSEQLELDEGDDIWNRLVERLQLSPGRWWAELYFDLVEDVMETTGLASDDPRLVTTVPASYDRLCVSINDRYVLTGMWKTDCDLAFIVGPEYELPSPFHDAIVHPGYGYNPNGHETEDTVPRFLAFEIVEDTTLPNGLIEQWTHYMTLERGYRSGSMHQQHHEPLVCRLARDQGLRTRLFEEAFDSE